MNKNYKILVVDDEIEICKIISKTLSKSGHKVDTVYSIKEADQFLSSNVPNLIIIDIVLPDGDGVELAKALSNNPKFLSTYILLMSGTKTTIEDRVKSLENGAVDFIVKPIRSDDLLARVNFIFRVIEREAAKRIELEKINDKLKISERRFNNLLENYPNGMITVFDRKYRFFYADGKELDKLNLKRDKMIGRTITDIFPREIAYKLMTFYDGVWRGNNIEFEYEMNEQTYYSAVTPIKNDEGIVHQILVITQNITEVKKVTAKLREQDELIKITNESISEVVWRINSDLKFQYVSPSLENLIGFSPDDVIGRSIFDLLPEDQKEEVIKNIKTRGNETGTRYYEYSFRKKDGGQLLVELSSTPIIDESGKIAGFSGVARDITEKKKAEIALKESEQKFRIFMDNLPAGIFLKTEDGKYEYVNKFNEDKFGLVDWKGKTTNDFFDKKTADEFDKEDRRVLEEGSIQQKISVKDKDGNELYFNTQYFPISTADGKKLIGGISVDITEETRTRKKLEESEENYRSIFENSALGIFRSTPEGRYKEVNKAFADILGFDSPEQMVSQVNDISKLYKNPDDREKIKDAFAKIGFVKDYEVLANHSKNNIVWISINASAQFGPNGEIYYEGTIQDITERKIAQEKLLLADRIVSSTEDGVAVLDTNYTYVFVNKGYENFAGRLAEDIIGKTVAQYLGEDVFDSRVKERFDKCLNGSTIQFEDWFEYRKLGKRYVSVVYSPFYNEKNVITGLVSTTRDITERKLAEEKLVKSELLLKNAATIARLGYYEIDLRTGDTIWSDETFNIFGLNPSDGQPNVETYRTLVHPDDSEEMFKKFDECVRQKKTFDMTYRIIHSSGEYRHVHSLGRIEKTPNSNDYKMFGTLQDVSDVIHAQLELKESKERFELAMQASQDGLFDWNLETNEIYYSPGWKKMLGYEYEELPNDFSVWETHTDPKDVEESWKMQQKLINKEIDRFVIEFKMKHKDGHWVDIHSRAEAIFNEEGKAIRIVGTHTDISEMKKALQLLKESEEKHRLLFENAGSGIGYYSIDGTILKFNAFAASLMNGTPANFEGKKIEELYGEKSGKEYLRRIKICASSEETFHYEDTVEMPTGEKWFHSVYKRIINAQGQVTGVQIISNDITNVKNAEIALQEKISELERFNKLMVGRENQMIKLKIEINELCEKLNLPKKYKASEKDI